MAERWARIWFATTATVAIVGLVIETVVTATVGGGYFTSAGSRLLNMLFYFTIQSNVIVAVTTLLLAVRLDRPSAVFRYFRLAGVVGITVTGVVYRAVLADNAHFVGLGVVADTLLHAVVPVLAVLGWAVFGPRRQFTWRLAPAVLIHPALWLTLTLVRGSLIDWYPYYFVDASRVGYGRVAVNAATLAGLFLAFAYAATLLDRVILRRPAADQAAVNNPFFSTTGTDRVL
jgi:hypothetical protein